MVVELVHKSMPRDTPADAELHCSSKLIHVRLPTAVVHRCVRQWNSAKSVYMGRVV